MYFRSGTYTGISVDWTDLTGIRLLNFPNERPVLDGEYRFGQLAALRDGVSNVTFSGLTITHYDNVYGNGAIDLYGAVSNVTIENNLFDANGTDRALDHHLYFGSGSARGRITNITVRNNTFRNAAAGNIHSFGGSNATGVVVENNRFVGGKWGILISNEGQSDWDIRNNTFVNATDSAVALGYYARAETSPVARIRLSRNIMVASAGAFALRVDQPQVASGALIDLGNIFWTSGGGAPVLWAYPTNGQTLHIAAYRTVSGQGAQSLEFDPQLVDAGGSDLRPAAGSAAVGWGAS